MPKIARASEEGDEQEKEGGVERASTGFRVGMTSAWSKRKNPRIWTIERYRFILLLWQLGEDQLRRCGETRLTDRARIEAGIRLNNKQVDSPIPDHEIKKKALEFTSRLADARRLARP